MKISEADFRKTRLDNGIRIVTERIPYVRSVSIGVWFTVGAANETQQTNGLSHFIEHMMFKGTRQRKAIEIAESLESVGGQLNAFTGKEITCYYAHILDEHLPIAVDILADILINSIFDKKEMAKEKQVILEELNALDESPEDLVHDLFMSDLFPNHPLGFSIIGKRENILKFTRDDISRFLSKHYATGSLVIAAAGNVDHENLVELVNVHFKKFNNAGSSTPISPSSLTFGKNIIENGAIQAHVCLGTQSYSYRDRKKFSLLVLNTLLGSGMSSRLFQNLREKHGLAYSVYSFIDFMHDTGLFGVYIGTDKEKIDDSIHLIHDELRRLTNELVSEEELKRTKSQLKGNLMLGLESTSSRMSRLAKMEIYLNRHFTLDHTLHEIEKISRQNIIDVANELFHENRIFTTVLKPKSIPGGREQLT